MTSTTMMAERRQQDSSNGTNEYNPNVIVYRKMERLVQRMQDDKSGVPVRTVKSFMSKVPSVFTGADLVLWIMKNLDVDTTEALHLGSLISAHGYFFPITDHVLTLKDDNTFYRFQTPYFWPSNHWEPENTDYAVYLCKRTMQNKSRLELADYEAENLARLQRMFSRKWEFIFMQAEAQAKVDKKRDKMERKVLDSQERAFWDVHRPVPGCVNTTEMDIKKACRLNKPLKTKKQMAYNVPGGRISPSVSESDLRTPIEELQQQIEGLKKRLERRKYKLSKIAELLLASSQQYCEYDSLITASEPSNPWISDDTTLWDLARTMSLRDVPIWRVKRWGFTLDELLIDPLGREQFAKFLAKEFSDENLRFWIACVELRGTSLSQVPDKVQEIYDEFLCPSAHSAINVDSKIHEIIKDNMQDPGRYTFDPAMDHIFQLMKSDSYTRYLRSDQYRELLNPKKKILLRKTKSLIPKLPSLANKMETFGQS
ncbi:regulator of G-protein signaling 7-like [Saccoglossus kowalevskii]